MQLQDVFARKGLRPGKPNSDAFIEGFAVGIGKSSQDSATWRRYVAENAARYHACFRPGDANDADSAATGRTCDGCNRVGVRGVHAQRQFTPSIRGSRYETSAPSSNPQLFFDSAATSLLIR